ASSGEPGRRKEANVARYGDVAWLIAVACGLGGFTAAPAQTSPPPAAPARASYADPAGLVKPGDPHPGTVPAAAEPAPEAKPLPIDLPYALRMVNASNPTIALAQARVDEAYAHLQQAEVAWLPDLWAGGNPDNLTFMPNYYVHNGILQNSRGM